MKISAQTTKDLVYDTVNKIRKSSNALSAKKATVGFDGCIDTLVYLIKNKRVDTLEVTNFTDMVDFGEYVISKGGKSCSIEYNMQSRKIGGNAPIFSNVLGANNVKTNLIATLGYPEIEDVFADMSDDCDKYSYGPAQKAMALEFTDGKIFLSPCHQLTDDAWKLIKSSVGENAMKEVFTDADLLALLNWSELTYATELWEDLLNYVIKNAKVEKEKFVFVDLADCSRNRKRDKLRILKIVSEFTKYRTTILSVNENEAIDLFYALDFTDESDIKQVAIDTAKAVGIDALVVHTRKESIVVSKDECSVCDTDFQKEPVISTGGGDNYNAGFALGLLLGLDYKECGAFANSTSSYYVSTGKTPRLNDIAEHLDNWCKRL